MLGEGIDLGTNGHSGGCLTIQVLQEFFVLTTRKIPKPLDASVEPGCKTLHSEDLSSGQIYEGMQVRNPFAA